MNVMSVPAAYLGVILIWATTPLAIKWSGDGPGFLFGVTSRMAIAAVLALLLARLAGHRPWRTRAAFPAYGAAGLGIYGTMLATYWGAQQIPSGWISVLFGLSPMMTGLLATRWLPQQGLTPARGVGTLLGLGGLLVIFGHSTALNGAALAGIGAVLLGALIQSGSAIAIKRVAANVPPLALVAGGLAIAAPLFILTWLLVDGSWPAHLPNRAAIAILYLAVVGSLLGFTLYYYLLARIDATRAALITLVTPMAALLIGHLLNREPLTWAIVLGAGLIIAGLAVFELGDRLLRQARRRLNGRMAARSLVETQDTAPPD